MSRPIVWLSGPPGSGKTTAGRTAAAELGAPFESAGEIFRAEAKARSMGLPEFSKYAEEHPEVDRSLDDGLAARARPGAFLDGRVIGAILRRRPVPVLAIQVTASESVRAERVARRDGIPVAKALAEMRLRSASERARYRHWYGIDLDTEPWDAVVDATTLAPRAVADEVIRLVRASGGTR